MTPGGDSVFDLSPSEKLQLVEGLWDDLAATPEAVPVHGWQKEELARQGETLDDLRGHLRDLYADLNSGQLPGIRKVDDLTIS